MSQALVHPVEFHGNGWEYAKIYFVNLALSIITLGIYSAWAKVRNKRYFYGHTRLDGNSFDYHARPVQILKGRLLVVGAFVLYNVIVGIVPTAGGIFFLLFLAALPWLILRATQFNMRNSSYRQIHFDFLGDLGELFIYYVLLPTASMFTLWLAYPFAVFKQKQYMANNSRFGQSSFLFTGKSGEFFLTYLTVLLGLILLGVVLNSVYGEQVQAFFSAFAEAFKARLEQAPPAQLMPAAPEPSKTDPAVIARVMLILAAVYGTLFLMGMIIMTYIKTRLTNYLFNNLKLTYVRFRSELRYMKLLWIYLSNVVLILLTCGIFIPWAKVRAVRYRLSCLTVYAADLEHFVAGESERTRATGEEMSDFLDIDVGF